MFNNYQQRLTVLSEKHYCNVCEMTFSRVCFQLNGGLRSCWYLEGRIKEHFQFYDLISLIVTGRKQCQPVLFYVLLSSFMKQGYLSFNSSLHRKIKVKDERIHLKYPLTLQNKMSRCYISHSASQEMSYQKSVIFQFFSAKPKDLIS